MIFVTVGIQLPFERLVNAVDVWAKQNNCPDVFAQTGRTSWKPSYIDVIDFLSPVEFQKKFQAADLVIGHAGMGTIITAMEHKKPLLVMPRDASQGEHRNNHQLTSARRFLSLQYIDVAFDEAELVDKLKKHEDIRTGTKHTGNTASLELIETIRNFIEDE